MSIDRQLLEILACPACKANVTADDEHVVCTQCGRQYPIRDDIPIMLLSEAEGGQQQCPTDDDNE